MNDRIVLSVVQRLQAILGLKHEGVLVEELLLVSKIDVLLVQEVDLVLVWIVAKVLH